MRALAADREKKETSLVVHDTLIIYEIGTEGCEQVLEVLWGLRQWDA